MPPASAQGSSGNTSTPRSDVVEGSGRVASQVRPIPRFEAVSITGPMRVALRPGTSDSLTVRADDNLLPLIETRVVTHGAVPTLEIGVRPNTSFSTRSELSVAVGFSVLKSVALNGTGAAELHAARSPDLRVALQGSGSARLVDAVVDALAISIAGSGGVQAEGRADRLSIEIAGSGALDAARLDADVVTASLVGSGSANVQARGALSVSIAGSGDVVHSGAAVPRASISGSGSVRRR
jgi:hypothetical protein